MTACRLLVIIADRCPWHVLLIDTMSVKLREQGITCGVVGFVEQGILDAANIAGLRRLADKTGGAWDLANGRELSEAIYTLGLHLYHKAAQTVTMCEIVVLDAGHLTLFRNCVESGVRRLTESLAAEGLATDVFLHWHSASAARIHGGDVPPNARPWQPPRLDERSTIPTDKAAGKSGRDDIPDRAPLPPSAPRQLHAADAPVPPSPGVIPSSDTQRSRPGLPDRSRQGSAVCSAADRFIRWGLFLSGGALISALALLAKR